MYCPKCATENPKDAMFCRQCGAQMSIAPATGIGTAPKKTDAFFKWVGYIVVGLFVLGILSNL